MADQKLLDAIKIVSVAIDAEFKRLREIAADEEADPVIVAGRTTRDVDAHCMVCGQLVAKVYLKYDFPIYRILELDAPDEMWDELAELTGLGIVNEADM